MQTFDDVGKFNRDRWNDLAAARISFSRPALDLTEASARLMIDDASVLGPVSGKDVLCLAASGGQQSAAFALLGANVTVLDFSEVQLERDALAARHYGFSFRLEQGDMRDLSRFPDATFDIVWQAHSINFIPDPRRIFVEVSRILRRGGMYRLSCTNPFIHDGKWNSSWTGKGYLLAGPYGDGEILSNDRTWTFHDDKGEERRIEGPREFRHTFSTILNGMIAARLQIVGLWEDCSGDSTAQPGTWEHFKYFVPPWITVVAQRAYPMADMSATTVPGN